MDGFVRLCSLGAWSSVERHLARPAAVDMQIHSTSRLCREQVQVYRGGTHRVHFLHGTFLFFVQSQLSSFWRRPSFFTFRYNFRRTSRGVAAVAQGSVCPSYCGACLNSSDSTTCRQKDSTADYSTFSDLRSSCCGIGTPSKEEELNTEATRDRSQIDHHLTKTSREGG